MCNYIIVFHTEGWEREKAFKWLMQTEDWDKNSVSKFRCVVHTVQATSFLRHVVESMIAVLAPMSNENVSQRFSSWAITFEVDIYVASQDNLSL